MRRTIQICTGSGTRNLSYEGSGLEISNAALALSYVNGVCVTVCYPPENYQGSYQSDPSFGDHGCVDGMNLTKKQIREIEGHSGPRLIPKNTYWVDEWQELENARVTP